MIKNPKWLLTANKIHDKVNPNKFLLACLVVFAAYMIYYVGL